MSGKSQRKGSAIGKNKDDLNLTSSSTAQCRICWGSEDEVQDGANFNPLISPCACTGTISNIHLKCLKDWLETKRTMKVHRG